jgi:hypothetical protein
MTLVYKLSHFGNSYFLQSTLSLVFINLMKKSVMNDMDVSQCIVTCKAALKTRSLPASISARDLAMSAITVPG